MAQAACQMTFVAGQPTLPTAALRKAKPGRCQLRVAASMLKTPVSISGAPMDAVWKAETFVTPPPETMTRPGVDAPDSMRCRFEKMIRDVQDSVCKAIEDVDGTKFRTDAWTRPGGGGGITRVMQNGNVWEKAGVNVSVVYGSMPPEAYRAAIGKDVDATERVLYFVAGISTVMHPWNPHCASLHGHSRYFQTEDWNGIPGQWWFGGGVDIIPSWVVPEDMAHFHGVCKAVCDRHDPAYYPKFKAWCDEYCLIKHRGETYGLGGFFYDDLNDRDPKELFAFATDAANHMVEAYLPVVKRHINDPYTDKQKEWQQIRRGRYVEFNMVCGRGTAFGLMTGARTESILMALPLTASWMYDYHPAPGSPEADFIDACRNPRSWV
eukprot:scaffold17.g589.t1